MKRFNFPFSFEIPPIGFSRGLWILWHNTYDFHLETLYPYDGLIYPLINDGNNNFE